MKYIIIGLGNYGHVLAEELSALGHEVIGADISTSRVESLKDKVAASFVIDATDEQALSVLPLKNVDVVIKAFNLLCQKYDDVYLTIIGGSGYSEQYVKDIDAMIEASPQKNHITRKGLTPFAEIKEIMDELKMMAEVLSPDGTAVADALEAGAVPIYEQMRANASNDPKIRTGTLYNNITIGEVKSVDADGVMIKKKSITIGARYGKGKANHAHLVEFGHAGPTPDSDPTPPHPFVRPAFDAKKDDAYAIIRDTLTKAVT